MKDLNDLIPADLGWTINSAMAINSDGKIAAYGDNTRRTGICTGGCPLSSLRQLLQLLQPLTRCRTWALSSKRLYHLQLCNGHKRLRPGGWDCALCVLATVPNMRNERGFLYDEGATQKMQDLGFLSNGHKRLRPSGWELFAIR